MTKRPAPFEAGISRQTKYHLNNYENDLDVRRDIQERTLKKLLEGAKKAHSIVLTKDENPKEDRKRNLTQKCVTNYFTLNGKISDEKCRESIPPYEEVPDKCSFCDMIISTYQCINCSEFYCSSCSFPNYESFEDDRICILCS